MKAIETYYAGCRFRSRLEARWAVFFDTLGITWEYEPQGIQLPSGDAYLPDFHLTACDTWIEVKGSQEQFERDGARLWEASLELHPSLLLLLGPVPRPSRHHDYGWSDIYGLGRWGFGLYDKNNSPSYLDNGTNDALLHWHLKCETAHECQGQINPNDDFVLTCTEHQRRPNGWACIHAIADSYEPARAEHAYRAARSARFEHGESG